MSMHRKPRSGGETVHDLRVAVDGLALADVTAGEAVAAAECVIRHATGVADAETLLEMIGVDAPRDLLPCRGCGAQPAHLVHAVLCEPDLTAARIHLLADACGRTP